MITYAIQLDFSMLFKHRRKGNMGNHVIMIEEKRREKIWINNRKEKNIDKHEVIDHAQFALIEWTWTIHQVEFVVLEPVHDYHSFLDLDDVLIQLIHHVFYHVHFATYDVVLARCDKHLR